MFYEGLEKTDLEAVLKALTQVMGEDYVQLIVAKNPPNAVKRQVDWLHSMCCVDSHDKNGFCNYYDEEILDDGWTAYNHRSWLDLWKDYTKNRSQTRLQELIYSTMYVLKEIQVACDRDPELAVFLTALLEQNPCLLIPIPRVITPPQKAPVPAEIFLAADDLTDFALCPEE